MSNTGSNVVEALTAPLSDTAQATPIAGGAVADETSAVEHGMTAEEFARICHILGRSPNATELGMYSVMWSEHCSYKSSKVHLRTLPTDGPAVLLGPGENAGAVDLGNGLAGVFKVESHNHPSYIEPYQGAATGVGGILRDIFTMGARPLALLNSLRFGLLQTAKNRFLLEGVVGGIAGYGNCMGVPTVGGEVYFDSSYDHNPLVNVMCFGVVAANDIVKARADGVGNPVIYVGAKTGRDGIYGVSLLASATFDAEATEKRPAVQVGDPFTEKLLMEACLEICERGLLVGMQDMGGAGLTCATSEMASNSGTGMEIDIAKVPRREADMSAYEVMLSESQERMMLVCEPDRLEQVLGVFDKWELDAVVVGSVTDDGNVRVLEGGELVANVPAQSLAEEGPCYDRPFSPPAEHPELRASDLFTAPVAADSQGGTDAGGSLDEPIAAVDVLLALVADPTLSSKRWIFQQYDQTVRFNTIQRPGGDAAVVRLERTPRAVALSLDGNPWFAGLDPRRGAALAVAEACRNVACTGAQPLAITNCLNFGSPEEPDRMGQFAAAVAGMSEACRELGVPVTGGNVSFYNETVELPILPTPVIGALGLLADGAMSVPSGFQRPGDSVWLLGAFDGSSSESAVAGEEIDDAGLGGSAYVRLFHESRPGAVPGLDLGLEARLQRLLVAAAADGLLHSAHDCADGGLAVALAECCFHGADAERTDAQQASGVLEGIDDIGLSLLGADLELPGVNAHANHVEIAALLFGERPTRVVASVAREQQAELERLAAELEVPAVRIGHVTGVDALELESSTGPGPAEPGSDGSDRSNTRSAASPACGPLAPRLTIRGGGSGLLDHSCNDLYRAWASSLAAAMEGK